MERGFFVALHALRPVVAGATGSPLTQMISGKHHNAVFIGVALLVWCMGVVVDASATEYDAVADLYNVDYFKLENGFDVVLKKRTHAHNVAVRLVVNVGQRNFPCHKRETPHFLEHLLFMGTSKHTEAELKSLIEDHGWILEWIHQRH